MQFDVQNVSVAGAGNTTLCTVPVVGVDRIFCEIDVSTQALDVFQIQGAAITGTYQTLYSTAADYTSPTGILVGTSGDLTAIPAASDGWFVMEVRGIHAIRLIASAAADSAVVDVYISGD